MGDGSRTRDGTLARAPSAGLVIGAIASVQFGSALAATLFQRLGPSGAVALRLLFAAIILVVIWRPRLHWHDRSELLLVGAFGLVLAAMNLAFYGALHRIPLGIAVAIEFVGPLGVAIAGSRRRIDVLWVTLAIIGILTLTRGGTHGLNGFGVFLALAAGGFWGGYILLNARVGRAYAGSTGLALAMCLAAILALPFGIIEGGARLLGPEALALGAVVGILSSVIPYSFEIEALRRIPPSVFGVFMSLEPAAAALAGFLVLGQGLSGRSLLGIAFVMAASVGASRRVAAAPLTL